MEERLKRLRELRDAAAAAVKTLTDERKQITDTVTAEARADLTEEEDAEFRAKTAAIAAEQDKYDDLHSQIVELEREMKRSGQMDADAQEVARGTHVEVNEPLTYEKGNGVSYFRDLAKMSVGQADEVVKERLNRHATDVSTNRDIRKLAKVGNEYRNLDRNDGTGGYFVPPLWAMQRFIELARAGRAYANLCPTEALPSGTDSINIPKVSTGTSTAIQTADNATISETDLADTYVQANVKTIAGMQGLAIQLIEQSPVAFDEIIFRDLAADYATKLDVQVISGSNGSGQVKGVRGSSGIITITATDAGSELSKAQTAYKKIADAVQRVHTQRFLPPEVIVMHPRRWAAFTALFDGNDRPLLITSGAGENQIGEFGGVVAQQIVGTMHGLPVVTDPSMPTTLGAGTNEDVVHVLRASDLLLFESSIRTRALQETRATTLTVLLQVYGFLAFTAERQPKSIVEIGGTALTAPTFA
jgi:HK97 family phage major capsid protein